MSNWIFEPYPERADGGELWMLRLKRWSRLPAPLFGLAAGLLVGGTVLLPVAVGAPSDPVDVVLSAAFFGMSIAVLAGFTPHVFNGAARDLGELAPVVGLSAEEATQLSSAMVRMPAAALARYTLIGVAIGLVHCWLLGVFHLEGLYAVTQGAGTLSLWVTMFWTVPALLSNAEIFSWLGDRADVDLLRPERLAPFGATAVRPTLYIIGMLCAYPIIVLPAEMGFASPSLLGFGASIASMFGLFFLPLRGIRRAISRKRQAVIKGLDARLSVEGDIEQQSAERLREIETVLALRDRIAHVSSWPLDLAGVRRVLLYFVLPPLTWAMAAMVEMLIDQQL